MKDIRKLIDEHHIKNSKGKEIIEWLNGLKHGISTAHWNSGNKRNIIKWQHGDQHGIAIYYYSDIELISIISQYRKHMRHGVRINFRYEKKQRNSIF